jgi:hypothetical protein
MKTQENPSPTILFWRFENATNRGNHEARDRAAVQLRKLGYIVKWKPPSSQLIPQPSDRTTR